jgi:hypothetical protein
MHINTAIALIEGITYKPGWTLWAEDFTKRYEETVLLHLNYSAPDTDVKYAPEYAVFVPGGARANFAIMVGDCDDPMSLYRKVFEVLMRVEYHESREFFSVNGEYFDKPFHPHTMGGMKNWAAAQAANADADPLVFADLAFGVA